MSVVSRRFALIVFSVTCLAAATFLTAADSGTNGAGGGVTPPANLTVGGLARIIVSEVALNAPAGGFDERFSMGVLNSIGYEGRRGLDNPATVGDLRAMLSTFGVETAASRPQETLSIPRVSHTLDTVRTVLPRFTVPRMSRNDNGGDPERPGPCVIALQSCLRECRTASPSGTNGQMGQCVHLCQSGFTKCRRGIEAPPGAAGR